MLQSEANRETCSHWMSIHILSVSNGLNDGGEYSLFLPLISFNFWRGKNVLQQRKIKRLRNYMFENQCKFFFFDVEMLSSCVTKIRNRTV